MKQLESLDPEAIAAPLDGAIELAEKKMAGLVDLPSLFFAFVILTDASNRLGDAERDLVWRAFRVPVFEYLLDADGNVIARECEIHDGLHLAPGSRVKGGGFRLYTDHCECGLETPRLKAA